MGYRTPGMQVTDPTGCALESVPGEWPLDLPIPDTGPTVTMSVTAWIRANPAHGSRPLAAIALMVRQATLPSAARGLLDVAIPNPSYPQKRRKGR